MQNLPIGYYNRAWPSAGVFKEALCVCEQTAATSVLTHFTHRLGELPNIPRKWGLCGGVFKLRHMQRYSVLSSCETLHHSKQARLIGSHQGNFCPHQQIKTWHGILVLPSHPVCESVCFYFQASHHSKTISSAHCPHVNWELEISGKSLSFFPFALKDKVNHKWGFMLKKVQIHSKFSNCIHLMKRKCTLWPFVIKASESPGQKTIGQLQNCNSIILQRGSQRKALEFITCFFDPCRARALAPSPVP